MSAKERRRIGGIAVIVLQFVVGRVLAAEWETSNGDHCINACKFHDDGNLYHWCTTAFGREPDMSRKWDYCTPSEFTANPGGTQQDPEDEGQVDNGDNAPSRPNFGGLKTALYNQTDCKTSCVQGRLDAEESYTCDTDTNNTSANVDVDADNNNQTWFYCAREQELSRKQLSAQYGLWCVDDCKRNDTAQGFTCNTLYGPDLCSPGEGKTVSGSPCSSPCAISGGEYSCYTKDDESTWEYCGFHGVPEEKKGVLEFTVDDVVCADYCSKKRGGDYVTCSVVDWSVVKGKANLMLTWNYCRGEEPPLNSGTIIGICIFLVGLSIPSIAILYASCCWDKNKDILADRARNRAAGTKGEGMEEKNLTSV